MNFFQKISIKDKITLLYKYLQHLGHCLQEERPVKGPVKPQTTPSSASTQKQNVPEKYLK